MRPLEVHRGVTDVRTAAPTVACHSLMPEEADLRGGDQREGASLQRAVHVNAVDTVARSTPVAAPLEPAGDGNVPLRGTHDPEQPAGSTPTHNHLNAAAEERRGAAGGRRDGVGHHAHPVLAVRNGPGME